MPLSRTVGSNGQEPKGYEIFRHLAGSIPRLSATSDSRNGVASNSADVDHRFVVRSPHDTGSQGGPPSGELGDGGR